mmetsp:Transcript_110958/g.294848  ORF Transcript_110958/g.294848 Transcript_110958/m.294848 type:complete len:354 (-) Transcript_110958:213-1274(-)
MNVRTHDGCSLASKPSETQKVVFAMRSKACSAWPGWSSYRSCTMILPMSADVSWFGSSLSRHICAKRLVVNSIGKLPFPIASATQLARVKFFAQTRPRYCETASVTSSRLLAAFTVPATSDILLAYVRKTTDMRSGTESSMISSSISSYCSSISPLVSYFLTSSSAFSPFRAVIEYRSATVCKSSTPTSPVLSTLKRLMVSFSNNSALSPWPLSCCMSWSKIFCTRSSVTLKVSTLVWMVSPNLLSHSATCFKAGFSSSRSSCKRCATLSCSDPITLCTALETTGTKARKGSSPPCCNKASASGSRRCNNSVALLTASSASLPMMEMANSIASCTMDMWLRLLRSCMETSCIL